MKKTKKKDKKTELPVYKGGGSQKASQKASFSRSGFPKLTKIQEEILELLTDEELSVKKIANRRGCSVRAVNYIKKKLIRIGAYSITNNNLLKGRGYSDPSEGFSGSFSDQKIRLHSEQFSIKILNKYPKYLKLISNGALRLSLDGVTIMCYKNKVILSSNKSFYGNTNDEADFKSMSYMAKIVNQLEQEINCLLVKNRSQNVIRVKAHYAETNNEIAKESLKKNQRIAIRGEDGLTWVLVDNSFNLKELEAVHPRRSKEDMEEVIKPFLNTLRGNPNILNDMMGVLNRTSQTMYAMAKQQELTQKQFSQLLTMLGGNIEKPKKSNLKKTVLDKADYIG